MMLTRKREKTLCSCYRWSLADSLVTIDEVDSFENRSISFERERNGSMGNEERERERESHCWSLVIRRNRTNAIDSMSNGAYSHNMTMISIGNVDNCERLAKVRNCASENSAASAVNSKQIQKSPPANLG